MEFKLGLDGQEHDKRRSRVQLAEPLGDFEVSMREKQSEMDPLTYRTT